MGESSNNFEYDIIVIGSGLAGICTALEALERDETITVLLIDDAADAQHPRHDTFGVADLDALIGKTKNAEVRSWLKQHGDAFVRDDSACCRLSCVGLPSSIRTKRRSGSATSETLLKNARTRPESLLQRLEHQSAFRAVRLVCGGNGGVEEEDEEENEEEQWGSQEGSSINSNNSNNHNNKVVTGVECEVLPPTDPVSQKYIRLKRWVSRQNSSVAVLLRKPAKRVFFRARIGVVLATTGGNPNSDDNCNNVNTNSAYSSGGGAGVALARQTGGDVAYFSRQDDKPPPGSSQSTPPPVLPLARTHMCGIAVAHETGRRFSAEDADGKAFSRELARKAGGEAFLILDARQWAMATKKPKPSKSYGELKSKFPIPKLKSMSKEMKEQQEKARGSTDGQARLLPQPPKKPPPPPHRHQKAKTLDRLAQKIGTDADGLGQAVSEYNEAIRTGQDDAFRKSSEHCQTALKRAPFYAVDISLPRGRSPTPRRKTRVVGFIRIEEESGLVLDAEGRQIRGLYAAGQGAMASSVLGSVDGAVYPLDDKCAASDGLDEVAHSVISGRRAGRHAVTSRKRCSVLIEE
ncbi:FAD binding domain-containing protein [Apiospora saccharicola]